MVAVAAASGASVATETEMKKEEQTASHEHDVIQAEGIALKQQHLRNGDAEKQNGEDDSKAEQHFINTPFGAVNIA